MKQIKLFGLLLVLAAMFMTSCEDDILDPGPIGGGSDAQIVLIPDAGFESGDIVIAPGEVFNVRVDATAGEVDLQTFSVEVDGVRLDPTRYTINGTQATSEQTLLFGDDILGFTYDVAVTAHADVALSTYAFVVTDVDGNSETVSILVDTDNGTGGGGDAPDVVVGGGSSIDLDPNALYSINISATPLSGTLASIAVWQDGALISDISRLEFDGNDFTANPFPFPAEYENGFMDRSIFIRVQDSGSSDYTVVITDSFGGETSFVKTVNVMTTPTGTPVDQIIGILLNQAGPSGTGGLDLDTGASTGSTDVNAEIRDNGIDQSQPDASNWIQSINSVNGSTIRVLTPGQNGLAETFSFADVLFKEELAGLHSNNASDYTGQTVITGDLFTVERGGVYYVLEVTNVNVTSADNNDSYTFNVKS